MKRLLDRLRDRYVANLAVEIAASWAGVKGVMPGHPGDAAGARSRHDDVSRVC